MRLDSVVGPTRYGVVLASALLAGCAHSPATSTQRAGVDDSRTVVIEFWARFSEPCKRFDDEYVANPDVARALGNVRFVRDDIDTVKGGDEYERLVGKPMVRSTGWTSSGLGFSVARRIPVFVALVGDHVVGLLPGLPSKDRFVEFLDSVAALGGSEPDLSVLGSGGEADAQLLSRAARWHHAHERDVRARDEWQRVADMAGASADQRADAAWSLGALTRKGKRPDPHAAVEFSHAYAGTVRGYQALCIVALLKDVSGAEADDALRVNFTALHGDGRTLPMLAYEALVAHRYDIALTIAQQAVRLTQGRSWAPLQALAEVYYYRHEPEMAISQIQRAQTLAPENAQLQDDLDRYRRLDGTPSPVVENLRLFGLSVLRQFYGEVD